jgi:hypothetical protein
MLQLGQTGRSTPPRRIETANLFVQINQICLLAKMTSYKNEHFRLGIKICSLKCLLLAENKSSFAVCNNRMSENKTAFKLNSLPITASLLLVHNNL